MGVHTRRTKIDPFGKKPTEPRSQNAAMCIDERINGWVKCPILPLRFDDQILHIGEFELPGPA